VTSTIVVALIAAGPPTLAATLAFLAARGQDRVAVAERAAAVGESLDTLRTAVARIEGSVERVEEGVIDLRERVARLEGAGVARRVAGA
jgi:phage shock protein A